MIIATILASMTYASLAEWLLHRYVMHRPLGRFRYPFEAHAMTHHHIFKADVTYHLQRAEDKSTIPMAWWNGIALTVIASIPALIASACTGLWSIAIIFAVVILLYYCTYEYIHWCMHLPLTRRRLIERSWPVGWIFFRLNGHHLLHHRYMGKNFNVVLPLWDALLGTLMLRSPVTFSQARGPSVPDVQPK